MRARFFHLYTETEILEREYSIAGRLHLDASNWDFRKLIHFCHHLAEDLKKEQQELEKAMRNRS